MADDETVFASPVAGEGPLVGRVRELGALREALADACAGRGGVQLIVGDPGVGKTRLAAALAADAVAGGATTIWTRGWGRAAPAYWPWVEVVRGLCHAIDGDTLRRELGSAAGELLRLAPELADRLPAARPPAIAEGDSQIARFELFDAIVALLRARSAAGPVVVLIDDLQAVDEGSLVALDFVSRMLRDAAVLIVATMHGHVPQRAPAAQLALANILRAGRRLVLGGLTRDDVGRLIELTSGRRAPGLADRVHAATEGNPLFAGEIVALLLAEGRLDDPPAELPLPDSVRETIRRRLEPLDEGAVATLELAAVIGRAFGLPALEHASPLARDRIVAALDDAAQLGLVAALPGTLGQYRFGHALIRETLLAGITGAARMAAHRAVGEALEHIYRSAADAHLPELAHHFLCAAPRGELAKAVDYAERAGRHALDTLAYEQAAELFGRALDALELMAPDVPRRARLLLALGTAESRAGRASARARFEDAAAAARSIGADEIFARAALGAAPFALTPGYVDERLVELLVEALQRIGPGDDPLRVRLLGSLAVALYWSDTEQRRLELAREAVHMSRRLGDEPAIAIALAMAQLACCAPSRTPDGLELMRELFAITERVGESSISLAARSRHVDVLLELDDLAAADVALEALERLAAAARDRRVAAFVPLHRARRASLEGRFEDARRLLGEIAAISAELSASTIPITVASQDVVLTWLQHGTAGIADAVRGYADGAPAMPIWRAALAAGLAASGRRDEAQRELDRLAASGFAALPRDSLWLGAIALLAETTASLGARERALELYALLLPFAGRNVVLPTTAFLGPVEMWLGILAATGGGRAQALAHLAAARAAATRNGARVSLARIAVEEAALLAFDADASARERAAGLLAEASAACDEIGLSALTERIGALRRLVEGDGPAAAGGDAAAGPVATLRRDGDVWTIDDGRRTLHLSDGRGLRLLAQLLERPGEEIHCLDLVAAVDGAPAGDESHSERARVNVTRAIRTTLRRIAGYDAELGRELEDGVRTGTFCVYEAHPLRPLHWEVTRGAGPPRSPPTLV